MLQLGAVYPPRREGGDTNLYRYAANNPFMLTDSTGLSWLSDLFDDIGDFFEDTFDRGNCLDSRHRFQCPPLPSA